MALRLARVLVVFTAVLSAVGAWRAGNASAPRHVKFTILRPR
jgi:hypothetical protein